MTHDFAAPDSTRVPPVDAGALAAEAAGLVTYLTDAVLPEDKAGLRAGHPVTLRPRPDGRTVEAWSPWLGRLGSLPPDDGEMLAPLLGPGRPGLTGMVSALVPRPGRLGGTRIHIRLS